MSMGFVLLCVQNVESAPGDGTCQITVVRNEKPAAQAQGAIVRTDAQSCTAKSQSSWADEAPLFKDLTQCLVHLLQRVREWCLHIRTPLRRIEGLLSFKEEREQLSCRETTVVSGCLWNRQRMCCSR